MLPALRGPAVFVPHIIRDFPLDRWLICPEFLFVWTGSLFVWVFFIPADCLFVFFFHTVTLCFISDVLGGRGFWPVVGRGVPFSSLVVFSRWSP